jgi:hypothetical protein
MNVNMNVKRLIGPAVTKTAMTVARSHLLESQTPKRQVGARDAAD